MAIYLFICFIWLSVWSGWLAGRPVQKQGRLIDLPPPPSASASASSKARKLARTHGGSAHANGHYFGLLDSTSSRLFVCVSVHTIQPQTSFFAPTLTTRVESENHHVVKVDYSNITSTRENVRL